MTVGLRDELGPYDEGWNARFNGFDVEPNPYGFDEPEYRRAWRNGWFDCGESLKWEARPGQGEEAPRA